MRLQEQASNCSLVAGQSQMTATAVSDQAKSAAPLPKDKAETRCNKRVRGGRTKQDGSGWNCFKLCTKSIPYPDPVTEKQTLNMVLCNVLLP